MAKRAFMGSNLLSKGRRKLAQASRDSTLVARGRLPTHGLYAGASGFARQALLLRGFGRTRAPALHRLDRRLADQIDQPRDGVGPVHILRAKARGGDDDDPL